MNSTFVATFTIIIVSILSCTYAVTNSTQDYFIEVQRKLQNDIVAAEQRVAAVETRANEHLQVFEQQHEVILDEMQNTDDKFIALQTLSPDYKRCVQKYRSLLVSVTKARTQFATCIATAQKRVNSLTTSTQAPLSDAKTSTNTQLPKYVTNCNTLHSKNQTRLEECVLYEANYYTRSVQKNLQTVDKNLEASKCSINDINKDVIQCSFVTENTVLVTIGVVTQSIDNCMNESSTMPPCCPCLPTNTSAITEVPAKVPSIRGLIMSTNN